MLNAKLHYEPFSTFYPSASASKYPQNNNPDHNTANTRSSFCFNPTSLVLLAISTSDIISMLHNQVLRLVVFPARKVRLEDGFSTGRISFLFHIRKIRDIRNWVSVSCTCASSEVPDMWGTQAFPPPQGFFAYRRGLSLAAGWGNHTSPPIPLR